MTAKITKSMLSLYIGSTAFLIQGFLYFLFVYASEQKNWWSAAFQMRIFYIPIIFYILMISIGIGGLSYLLISVFRKSLYSGVEEKLRLLANGNYESSLFSEEIPHSKDNRYIEEIDKDISKVSNKMKEISTELQVLNSRPQFVDGQTKEEILELERHRLARELHDSVSQQLFAAMMMMSALNEQAEKTQAPEAQRKQLAMVSDIINASQSEMRALLLHLRPVSLEGKSLKQGIEQLLKELQTKIKISLKWEIADIQLSAAIEDQLFRVIQELLSNTLRHAKAKELEVYLHQVEKNVLLRVIDDGVGFNPSEQKAGSYGLMNIRERVNGVGGTVKIISFKGQGTSVEIKIPLLKEVIANDTSITR